MNRNELIKNLEYTKQKYKDKFVCTGETNVYVMVLDMLRYLNQPTTEINIDYYNELKAKADKWVEKETPFKPMDIGYDDGDWEGSCKCGQCVSQDQFYCHCCGQKLDFKGDL